MDDVNEKLNALLSDPGSMAQIMQLAQQLSGSMGGENTPPSPPSPPQAVPPPAPLPAIDPQVIAKYLPLLQELTRDTSQTTQLLYALRPFLKDGKQNKVERAARLARLITIGKRFLSEGGGFPVSPLYSRRRWHLYPRSRGRSAAAPQSAAEGSSATPAGEPCTGARLLQRPAGKAAPRRFRRRRPAAAFSAVLPLPAKSG